jgi:hypothetical protein
VDGNGSTGGALYVRALAGGGGVLAPMLDSVPVHAE